jgi:ankyrin repeat protein
MAKMVMETRPGLVRQENEDKRTPIYLAAKENKIDVLTILLEHDPSLGYFISTDGAPLLCIAAIQGNVGVARELLRHWPRSVELISRLICCERKILFQLKKQAEKDGL